MFVRGSLCVFLWLVLTGQAPACAIPVFRYALERWSPAPYPVVVFHKGGLTADGKKSLDALTKGPAPANLKLELVDVTGGVPEALRAVWEAKPEAAALPWVVVRPPDATPDAAPLWTGNLAAETATLPFDSPAGRALAKHLVAGDAAVFLLLESGDAAADKAALVLLEERLPKLAVDTPLPKPSDEGPQLLSKLPVLKSFHVLRLPRKAAGEEAFVRMLLACDEGLDKAKGPIVFPVFGRGRVLCAMHGETLGAKGLKKVAEFLCGACSCRVKELNPGTDLLLAADWDAIFRDPKPAPGGSR